MEKRSDTRKILVGLGKRSTCTNEMFPRCSHVQGENPYYLTYNLEL
jgi:hypothetical protein